MECYLSVVITFFHFALKTLHHFKNRQMFLGKRKASWDPNTLKPHRPQHDRPATCVIAQQYYPATFVSLRFQFKEELCAHFKNVTASTSFTFLKNVSNCAPWNCLSWGVPVKEPYWAVTLFASDTEMVSTTTLRVVQWTTVAVQRTSSYKTRSL